MAVLDESALNVFTDGSSYSHPRRGGLSARFVWVNKSGNEKTYDYYPRGYAGATNNQMELQACIDALKVILGKDTPITLDSVNKIVIFTDSMYIVENWNRAAFSWSRNHWLTRHGKPVRNAQLWKEIVKLRRKIKKRVFVKWVRGHKDSKHNIVADKLAKKSAQQASKKQISVVNIRRKLSKHPTDEGSVGMSGQRITIRVVEDEWLKIQKCYRYRYEVLSKKSKYYQNVDFIYSEIMLSAGHIYDVKFNKEQKNPRILKLFKEIN